MNEIGLIGLGVMGKSLALNIGNKGVSISVYNKTTKKTKEFIDNEVSDQEILGYYDLESFVQSLKKPRKIMLMIKAGEPVDNMINQLIPLLHKGDLIMDGGNTYYKDTDRRIEKLNERGLLYLGVGISGGEAGALEGPSLMPGGSKEAYNLVEDILLKIAAQTESGPCCTYIGDYSAGHFVKMLHNGIEYGMMQAIAEVYDIFKKVLRLSGEEIGDIFEKWNDGELDSYLLEISYKIMRHRDNEIGDLTIEKILDKAGQKGTGKWTAQTSFDLGIPTPSLSAAVEGRVLSFFKEERIYLSRKFANDYPNTSLNKEKLINDLENSLLLTNFMLFSQGLWLIDEASKIYNYEINLSEVLRVWRGGCIIRARMLDFFREIIIDSSEDANMLNNKKSMEFIESKIDSTKEVINIAKEFYIPTLVHNSALDYFFSMTSENLPANLIQAQRDFFGAHTYSRIDKVGVFHTDWE
jgi:6-phosphogluconate dehydrogenase